MKHIYILLLFTLLPSIVFSQKKSKNTEQSMSSNAMNIKELRAGSFLTLFKNSEKNIISTSVYFKGGLFRQNEKNVGIENLLLQTMVNDGTESMGKDAFSKKAEMLGAKFSASAMADYSYINMTCPVKSWDESWVLFENLILKPAFNEENFQLTKSQILASLDQSSSDPDSRLDELKSSKVYQNNTYQHQPDGSKNTIESLDLNQVKTYYGSMKNQSKMFGVLVGNVKEDDIINKYSAFGKLPTTREMPPPPFTKTDVNKMTIDKENRSLATNYMMGLINAPNFDSKESVAMRMAFSILNDRYFSEIRTKRNLSYAPSAYFGRANFKNPLSTIYVTSTDPNQCAQVMIDELKKIRKEGFLESELKNKKETFLTQYFMRLETNNALDNMIGSYHIMSSWTDATTYLDDVKKLSVEDLNAVFKKYVNAIHWVYLGDESKVDDAIFLQKIIE